MNNILIDKILQEKVIELKLKIGATYQFIYRNGSNISKNAIHFFQMNHKEIHTIKQSNVLTCFLKYLKKNNINLNNVYLNEIRLT